MNPYLNNYHKFKQGMAKQIKVKKDENIQYNFDLEIDRIVKQKIKDFDITGKIFSEESGFIIKGSKQYRVIYDPFCNSSLATRTFQEAAMGISVFDWNYQLISSAILDYQTGLVGIVEANTTNFYQLPGWTKINISRKVTTKIDKSWIVLTLEKKEERADLDKVRHIFDQAGRIINSSGHIYWLKLATGSIDGYLDPCGGEKLYEMFAATIAQQNGSIVTNRTGEEFDPGKFLKIFEEKPDYDYYPVAATNKNIHDFLLGLQQ